MMPASRDSVAIGTVIGRAIDILRSRDCRDDDQRNARSTRDCDADAAAPVVAAAPAAGDAPPERAVPAVVCSLDRKSVV